MMESRILVTRQGVIHYPAYIPVTTFGKKYPLDDLIRPYLPRLAQAVMVSHYYARQMDMPLRLPMLVDSGGFVSLFKYAQVVEENGLGVIVLQSEDGTETVRPQDVLEFQESVADVAFTLDFPIPPGMAEHEARMRQTLTIRNAQWAIENRRRKDMPLFGVVQGWDADSARACARAYRGWAFDGIAIGGLVPRTHDRDLLVEIVTAVRDEIGTLPLHVFGIGHPELVAMLLSAGVDSVDSSAYVKLAADGRLWSNPDIKLEQPSPLQRLHLALSNLASATNVELPLSAFRALSRISLGAHPSNS